MHIQSNEFPYIALALKRPIYNNREFLQRLNIKWHDIPFERVGDERTGYSYKLDSPTAATLQRLEVGELLEAVN